MGLTRSNGPIRAVINAVGEYRTHSFISHGNGWTTHSTAYSPGRPGWPDYCSTPLKPAELERGYPGASQIDMGALYQFYYGGGGAIEAFWYQRSPASGAGNTVQSWLWTSSNYTWVASKQDSSRGLYRVGFSWTPNVNYVLYQYRDSQNIQGGNEYTEDTGAVCSTYLAYAQNRAGQGTISNNNTYNHSQTVAGINAIYNAVENECNSSAGFWGGVAAGITCFEGVCDDAARQVTNCFTRGICNSDNDSYYRQVRDNLWPPGPTDSAGWSTAVSISPDAIGGWAGHSWGPAAPNPVWSWDGSQSVIWNSSGSVYSCWF